VLVITWGGLASISLGLPIGLIILTALVLLYVVTKWKNVRADRRSLEQWRSRIGTLKDEIEKKLQEL
jgi:multisubunit Na+/H+ antiporter MnhB subunit